MLVSTNQDPRTSQEQRRSGPPDPAVMPLERVEAEICTLAGQIAAATARFLALLADFDEREGWAGWGVHSCAHWLSWRCGLSLHAGREYVRVARALQRLPRTREAFGAGRVSYSKVRALSRVATTANEDDLLHAALHNPAAHVERLVRGLKQARHNLDDQDARAGGTAASGRCSAPAGVQWRWDDDGTLKIWGRLAAEDGARLLAGLTRIDEQTRRADNGGPHEASERGQGNVDRSACGEEVPAGTSRPQAGMAGRAPGDLAPALVATAELLCSIAEPPVFAPAADVVVHVDVKTLTQADSAADAPSRPVLDPAAGGVGARLDDGPTLQLAVLQTLACDGRIQLSVHAPDGRVLDLGRRRRRPNRAQLDALWRRDRGCTHPGCGRTRFLHAHHVVPWAAGGRTDLDNLVLLCGRHHRALHDGAFSVVALGRQRFRFHDPRGAERPQAPAMRGRLTALTGAHRDIQPRTIEPAWDGTPLDLPHATDVFLSGWAVKAARNPAAAPAASAPVS